MENGVMMQYFEWNMPNDGDLWNQLKREPLIYMRSELRLSGFPQPTKP